MRLLAGFEDEQSNQGEALSQSTLTTCSYCFEHVRSQRHAKATGDRFHEPTLQCVLRVLIFSDVCSKIRDNCNGWDLATCDRMADGRVGGVLTACICIHPVPSNALQQPAKDGNSHLAPQPSPVLSSRGFGMLDDSSASAQPVPQPELPLDPTTTQSETVMLQSE